jgi:hypothetical protein
VIDLMLSIPTDDTSRWYEFMKPPRVRLRTPRRGARRLGAALVVAAAAMVAFAVLRSDTGVRREPAVTAPAPPPVAARPPSPPPAPPPAPVSVQVNAKPWARVRIDGRDVGSTPLTHPLAPGAHEFRAEFPGGKTLVRTIEIGPKQRLVTLR